MASFKTIEEEQRYQEQDYLKNFDAKGYYKDFCKHGQGHIVFVLSMLHAAFSLDAKTGDSILDLGCGPNIYTTIAASRRYKNIVVSDFLESNRNCVEKWLQNDSNAGDYKPIFKIAAALEHESDVTKLEARVRKSVKEVIPCNVHLSNPIAPDTRKFDVIISAFTLEAANLSLESYRRSIFNIANLLKPGGKFYLANVLKATHFVVAGHDFKFIDLKTKDINQALTDAGLNPCNCYTKSFRNDTDLDCSHLVFVESIKADQ